MFARPAGAEEELDDEWRREQKGESENTRLSQKKEEKEVEAAKSRISGLRCISTAHVVLLYKCLSASRTQLESL